MGPGRTGQENQQARNGDEAGGEKVTFYSAGMSWLNQRFISSASRPVVRWALSLCCLAAFAACTGERKSGSTAGPLPAEETEMNVFAEASLALHPELREDGPLARLYQSREGRPFWLARRAFSPAARQAVAELAVLAEARSPEQLGLLRHLGSGVESCRSAGCSIDQLLDLEVRLSAATVALAERQAHGRPRREGLVGWYLPPRELDVAAKLAEKLGTQPLVSLFAELAPATPDLTVLERALSRYQGLETAGGWRKLPAGAPEKTLHPGESFSAAWLSGLAERLVAEGYEIPAPEASLEVSPEIVFEGPLVEALRRFQVDHGLVPDGNLGKATIEALNVSVADRVRQIEVNLERLRWVKEPPSGRRIEVHVPAFVVEVWQDNTLLHSTKVIVGKRDWPTPLFEDEVSALILNPPWHVPDSIASDEILAKILANPAYLAEESMMVFKKGVADEIDPSTVDWAALSTEKLPYRFRQRPGPGNLLGKIKFSLPNHHNIYLHDTPGRSLFERADRALSHGCVRVDKPFALADVLVSDLPEWPAGELAKKADTGKELGIRLPQPIPVRLLYTTVKARTDGAVVFYRDLYGLDAAQ